MTVEGKVVPGQMVTVRGSLFDAEAGQAAIWWGNVNGQLIGKAEPDDDGEFVTQISIPSNAVVGQRYSIVASQGTTVTADGRTDSNNNGPGNQITVEAPAPLASTAQVPTPSPTPAPAPTPVAEPQTEVTSTPVAVEAPVPAPSPLAAPTAVAESTGLEAVVAAPVTPIANPVPAATAGLTLGQPALAANPAVVPGGDEAGPGAVVAGAQAAVGTPGQPAVVLGTPPPSDLGASRTSTPLVVGAAVLGLALLGLGAELARRRATAQA